MSKASGSYATHDRDSLPSFFGAQPQDLFPSPSQLGPPYHLTRVVGMDSSRSQPFHLPGQDVLTDMNLTPGGGDAPLRGIPKPWNILKFYDAGADDSPWVPPGIIVPDHRAGQGRHQNNPTALRDAFAPRYSEWRSPGPSECDTLPPGQLPSDSGYESRRTKQSIANASVFGDVDRGHETQSLTGRMDGFDPFEGMSSAPSYTGNSVNNHASMTEARGLSTLRTRGTAHSTVIICPDCGSHLKTKSELNKHKQRHSKPHKCDVSGCSRKEGFSTINDLDRHKRSVHRDTDTGGPRYRCHLAPCHNKKKIWPRADNFRSHLKRLHRVDAVDDDLAQYLIPFQQQDVGSLTEGMDVSDSTIESFRFTPYDQAMPPSMWVNHQSQDLEMTHLVVDSTGPRTELDISDASPASHGFSGLGEPNTGHAVHELPLGLMQGGNPQQRGMNCRKHLNLTQYRMDSNSNSSDATTPPETTLAPHLLMGGDLRNSSMEIEQNPTADRSDQVNASDTSASEADAGSSSEDLHEQENLMRRDDHSEVSGDPKATSAGSLVEVKNTPPLPSQGIDTGGAHDISPTSTQDITMTDQQINEFLHTVPKAVLEKFLREEHNPLRIEPTQARITAQANPQHPCPGCPKSFQRRCDLKHDKPYGCTFLNCYKSFGSKNDWKRHETSQHTQLEVWKCNERASNGVGTTCGKVFPRREDFKLHLQDTHNFRDVSALEAELHSCRIGRDCDLRYWCGFCEKIMGRSHTAMHPSTKRFDHIDDHFCGRNTAKRSISEWKHLETELSAAGSTPSSGNMETPKSSPDHQATARISPSNSGRLVSNCTLPGKRKSDDDSECPQSRRPRGQLATMWTCCNCTMQSSFRFNRACVSCPHSRCVDCQ
ncbi:hypothetical protein BN1708_004688 [Verticillium longisporum]|uniref:C2H2-type domain-containing protein n=1 Tax=Verticillium longisporum TaxID=100787 RepID=A0A0G4M2I6_VERLO|nr:hypothetical protein BN1708_004688 [Verticillium longisporum]